MGGRQKHLQHSASAGERPGGVGRWDMVSSSSITNSLIGAPEDTAGRKVVWNRQTQEPCRGPVATAVAPSHGALQPLRVPLTAEKCLCRTVGTGATSTGRGSAMCNDVLAALCLPDSLQGHVSRRTERVERHAPTGEQGMLALM